MWQLRRMTEYINLSQNTFTDLTSVMHVSGLFAVHRSTCAHKKARKKCEEVQGYGTDAKGEANL